jgi:hypothetical protein
MHGGYLTLNPSPKERDFKRYASKSLSFGEGFRVRLNLFIKCP